LPRKETSKYVKTWNKRYAWKAIIGLNKGYISLTLKHDDGKKKRYEGHRIAWLYVYGKFPHKNQQIDHINRIKSDNRICNLRIADVVLNAHNVGLPSNNKSGVKGVYWHKDSKKWMARISWCGKCYYLGTFIDLEEAKEAYAVASVKHAKEFSIYSEARV
jgi:HNH endonuclease/AP2 domain